MKNRFAIFISIIALVFSGVSIWLSYNRAHSLNNELQKISSNVSKITELPKFKFNKPDEVIKYWYKELWNTGSVPHFAIFDRAQFFNNNREEILETLEVTEVIENDDLAVAFVRFSIGTKIYRTTHWLRKIDNTWTYNLQYYSSYVDEDDDPFLKGKEDWLAEMLDKIAEWENESEKIWWK